MKRIKGHEDYGITSCGRVYNFKTNKFLKGRIRKDGYLEYHIQGKFLFAHRLVAEAYISNPDNLPTVDHIDRVKAHNYINNLRWASVETQNNNHPNCKKVRCIETGKIYPTMSAAGQEFGKAMSNLSACLKGKQKTWCGYHWEYVEG